MSRVRQPRTAHKPAHGVHTDADDSRLIPTKRAGKSVALQHDVIWFFEKNAELLVCEIRRPADNQPGYEFEIAESSGPTTHRFDSPQDLIKKYLAEQRRLMAAGWRPRAGDIDALQ
jgi:hypothetical protein